MDLWVDRGIDTWVVSAWSEREHVRDLLVAIGDLESFVKADDRRGGYARHGGYNDGSQEPPTPVEAELSQISYQSDLYQSDMYQSDLSDFGISQTSVSIVSPAQRSTCLLVTLGSTLHGFEVRSWGRAHPGRVQVQEVVCKKWYVLGKRVSSMTCPSTKSQTSHFMFFRAQNQHIF